MVPVAVDIRSKKPFGMGDPGIGQIIKEMRPKVEIKIGKPLEPAQLTDKNGSHLDVSRFAEILKKRKNIRPSKEGEQQQQVLTDEERREFHSIREALQEESDRVMGSLAELLPPEKRPEAKT